MTQRFAITALILLSLSACAGHGGMAKDDAMMKDELVEEVRKARQEQAAKWNFDLKAILADARKRQAQSGHNDPPADWHWLGK